MIDLFVHAIVGTRWLQTWCTVCFSFTFGECGRFMAVIPHFHGQNSGKNTILPAFFLVKSVFLMVKYQIFCCFTHIFSWVFLYIPLHPQVLAIPRSTVGEVLELMGFVKDWSETRWMGISSSENGATPSSLDGLFGLFKFGFHGNSQSINDDDDWDLGKRPQKSSQF